MNLGQEKSFHSDDPLEQVYFLAWQKPLFHSLQSGKRTNSKVEVYKHKQSWKAVAHAVIPP